jgi:glycosyltransferase involved in cell wall biosynthesis
MACTRSLGPEYHIDKIIMAVDILRSRNYKVHFDIVGEGAMRADLEDLIRARGLEKEVILHGKVKNEDLKEILDKALIYVSVPETEGASASLFEAMASGLFPVVSDIPSYHNWIRQSENGMLAAVGSHTDLAEKLQQLADGKVDIGKGIIENRQIAEEIFDIRKNVRSFIEEYRLRLNHVRN